jgi:ribose transport system permease protein
MNQVKAGATAAPADEVPAAPSPGRPRPRGVDLKSVGELGAFVVIVVVFWVLNPDTFVTAKNVQIILNQAALPLIIAVGATLVILMGSIDLSVEGVMGAAGMTFVLMTANSRGSVDYGVPVALIVALLVGAALGLLSGLIHTRLKVPSFIVTLGVWYVGLGIATLMFGTEAIPFLASDELKLWPGGIALGLPNSFWLAVLLVAAGAAIGRYTRLARWTYAIGNNEQIALGNGIPVTRVKVINFVGAAGCSAFAGVLASIQIGAGSATVGVGSLFLTIAAVVIGGTALSGGKGGILRSALGVLLLTTLNNGLILSGVSPNIQSGVSGAVLIAAIIAAAWPYRGRLRVSK